METALTNSWNKKEMALTATVLEVGLVPWDTISEFRTNQTTFHFPPIEWNKMEMALTATVLAGSRSSFTRGRAYTVPHNHQVSARSDNF